jgi:hypothetical protein
MFGILRILQQLREAVKKNSLKLKSFIYVDNKALERFLRQTAASKDL